MAPFSQELEPPTNPERFTWKAQVRLCGRYRKMMARGKRQTVVTTAIAREMAAFLWAIGNEVAPRSAV
jgi:transposase